MKKCSGCKQFKSINEFGKDLSKKDKLSLCCIECIKIKSRNTYNKNKDRILKQQKEYHIKFPWKTVWHDINKRCTNKSHSMYKYYGLKGIKNLFKNWNEIKFLWFRDNAVTMQIPSIHRIDSSKHYCIENCKFIELDNNIADAHNVKIMQFNKQNNFIKEWESIKHASESLKINRSTISLCLRERISHAGNFIWKYKENV